MPVDVDWLMICSDTAKMYLIPSAVHNPNHARFDIGMPLGEHSGQVIWFNLLFMGNHNHELATGDESVLSSKKKV